MNGALDRLADLLVFEAWIVGAVAVAAFLLWALPDEFLDKIERFWLGDGPRWWEHTDQGDD